MSKHVAFPLLAFAFSALVFLSLSAASPTAQAQKPLPPNDHAKGLVYDGLQVSDTGECKGAFKIQTDSHGQKRVVCTHGPDPAPAKFDVSRTVPPLTGAALATGTPSLTPPGASGLYCDGDGVTGNRVQVLYAHASDVPDGYSAYLPSFQKWVAGVDSIFADSAAQTGGSSHVRFVTDANCNPVIPDVTLSPAGDDYFGNTINELTALGYDRLDRKYLIFMDAHLYCGISTSSFDDQPGPANYSNRGDSYGRIDAGCWSDVIAAHELTHALGAVQMSAPHSDGNWHCNDGYDAMCDYAGHPLQIACANLSNDRLLDCNHDDYFNTNPSPGSYLATHWNVANNVFLISPVTARVDSVITGVMKGKKFVQSDTFGRGETVIIRVHVVDRMGIGLGSAGVSLTVNQPDGALQCTLLIQTDLSGTGQGSCSLPHKAPAGTWHGHVSSLTKPGYAPDLVQSVVDRNFKVR